LTIIKFSVNIFSSNFFCC